MVREPLTTERAPMSTKPKKDKPASGGWGDEDVASSPRPKAEAVAPSAAASEAPAAAAAAAAATPPAAPAPALSPRELADRAQAAGHSTAAALLKAKADKAAEKSNAL